MYFSFVQPFDVWTVDYCIEEHTEGRGGKSGVGEVGFINHGLNDTYIVTTTTQSMLGSLRQSPRRLGGKAKYLQNCWLVVREMRTPGTGFSYAKTFARNSAVYKLGYQIGNFISFRNRNEVLFIHLEADPRWLEGYESHTPGDGIAGRN